MTSAITKASPAQLDTKPRAQRVLDAYFGRQNANTTRTYRECLLVFANWLEAQGHVSAPAEPDPARADTLLAGLSDFLFKLDAGTANELVLRFVQEQEKAFAPNTVNLRLTALKGLVKLGRMLGAVSWQLDVKGPKWGKVKDTRGPDVATVKKVLDSARKLGPQHYAVVLLLFERGLRNIEVRELEVQHLKLDEQVIMVRGKGNTGLTRLTVSPAVVKALRTWLDRREALGESKVARRKLKGVTFESYSPGFVFCVHGDFNAPLSRWRIWDIVRSVGKETEGMKLWPHALRHSAITAALDLTDGNVRDVMKFSRHKNVQTVLTYDDERRDVGGQLSEHVGSLAKGEE